LLIIVTRPPRVIVTVDGDTRPSVPMVMVAESVGVPPVPPPVEPPPPVDGLVGVLELPPHAAAAATTNAAAATPAQTALVISKTSSKG
jgi:hypothetical protein